MTCGKYGALWPRPTGRVNLSDALVPVLPNNIIGFSIMQNGENDGMYLNNSENVALISLICICTTMAITTTFTANYFRWCCPRSC